MTLILTENSASVDEITSAWLPDESNEIFSELDFDAIEYELELSLLDMS